MGTQLCEHSKKCQMDLVNKLTEVVTQLTSSHNDKKKKKRSTADTESCDNSYPGEGDEEHDRRNMVNIY